MLWCEQSEIFGRCEGTCDILMCGRKVDILWWQESEIFWAVGGTCDISVRVRKVCIL